MEDRRIEAVFLALKCLAAREGKDEMTRDALTRAARRYLQRA